MRGQDQGLSHLKLLQVCLPTSTGENINLAVFADILAIYLAQQNSEREIDVARFNAWTILEPLPLPNQKYLYITFLLKASLQTQTPPTDSYKPRTNNSPFSSPATLQGNEMSGISSSLRSTIALAASALPTIQSRSNQGAENSTKVIMTVFGILATMISLGSVAIGYRQLMVSNHHGEDTEDPSFELGSTTPANTQDLSSMTPPNFLQPNLRFLLADSHTRSVDCKNHRAGHT